MRHAGGAVRSHHLETPGTVLGSDHPGEHTQFLRAMRGAAQPLYRGTLYGPTARRDVDGGGPAGRRAPRDPPRAPLESPQPLLRGLVNAFFEFDGRTRFNSNRCFSTLISVPQP